MTKTTLKALGIWTLTALPAMVNGVLREKLPVPLPGRQTALPLSGISLSLLVFLLSWLSIPRLGAFTPYQFLFEFIFGRLVAGKTWQQLLQPYDITTGDLWLLVLGVIRDICFAIPCSEADKPGLTA